MAEYVCNYSLIRFRPYRDAGEFVNIGVTLMCAELVLLDFRLELQRSARVGHFFPALDMSIYRDGLLALQGECKRWRDSVIHITAGQHATGEDIVRHIFGELTRTTESLFHLSNPRTVLAEDPAQKIDQLFAHYIRRQLTELLEVEEVLRQPIS
jgi:hypothetical protein